MLSRGHAGIEHEGILSNILVSDKTVTQIFHLFQPTKQTLTNGKTGEECIEFNSLDTTLRSDLTPFSDWG